MFGLQFDDPDWQRWVFRVFKFRPEHLQIEVQKTFVKKGYDYETNFGLPNTRYLSNLKPLGLAILLNTCNAEGHDEYFQFCNHIGQESLLNETSVPVVNKRCLCEFARQIGFKPSAATNDYHYLHSVSDFAFFGGFLVGL